MVSNSRNSTWWVGVSGGSNVMSIRWMVTTRTVSKIWLLLKHVRKVFHLHHNILKISMLLSLVNMHKPNKDLMSILTLIGMIAQSI